MLMKAITTCHHFYLVNTCQQYCSLSFYPIQAEQNIFNSVIPLLCNTAEKKTDQTDYQLSLESKENLILIRFRKVSICFHAILSIS